MSDDERRISDLPDDPFESQGEALTWEGVTTSTYSMPITYSMPMLTQSLLITHDDFCSFNGECKAMYLTDYTKACIFCKYSRKIDIPKLMEEQNP